MSQVIRRGGAAVARETKLGLLVGLAFIVLFGVILSDRAGSPAASHAALATGESEGHRTIARAVARPRAPFGGDPSLVVPVPEPSTQSAARGAAPPEEAVPAPKDLPAAPPPTKPDSVGTVAFAPPRQPLPLVIDTPMPGDPSEGRAVREEVIANRPAPQMPANQPSAGPPADAGKTFHTVRQGENLTIIAKHYYGPGGEKQWRRILEANRGAIRDANRLCAGQKLVIPPAPACDSRKDPPAAPSSPAGQPRRDMPAPEPACDSYFADSAKVAPGPFRDRAAVWEELRKIAVPVPEPGAPPASPQPARRPEPNRAVRAPDLGRIAAGLSDFPETPSKPPPTYTIQQGDTFMKVAAKFYPGDGRAARLLSLKNQHLVADEKRLRIGQSILLLDGDGPATPQVAMAKR
jgi:hypothetical protein